MATHPSILAWKISWTQEPGGLQSMGLQRVGHDWATNTHIFIHTYMIYIFFKCFFIIFYYKILNVTLYAIQWDLVVYLAYIQLFASANPKLLIYPSCPFPFGNHKFVFYVCGSISVLYISSFISFFLIPHTSNIIWKIKIYIEKQQLDY